MRNMRDAIWLKRAKIKNRKKFHKLNLKTAEIAKVTMKDGKTVKCLKVADRDIFPVAKTKAMKQQAYKAQPAVNYLIGRSGVKYRQENWRS